MNAMDANTGFVLKAMTEKWRRDKRKVGFCKFGSWTHRAGRAQIVPEEFFSDWVRRLTPQGFKDCIDSLAADGFIEVFTGGNIHAFYEVTEKGRKLGLSGQRAAEE
jgi:hypothetical protein